jgi:hypothetical protein
MFVTITLFIFFTSYLCNQYVVSYRLNIIYPSHRCFSNDISSSNNNYIRVMNSKIINKLHLSSIHNDDQDYLDQSNSKLHSSDSSEVVIITNTTSTNAYDIHDIIGITAKYVVSITSVVFIMTSNSIIPTYYILCGVINSIISKVLKNIIRQPRPKESKKPGYGMPSSHAQSISFFTCVLCLKLLIHGVAPHWIHQSSLSSPDPSLLNPYSLVQSLTITIALTTYSYYAW